MKQFDPSSKNIREHEGKIIFDKDGNPIGIAIRGDGSLDYVSPEDEEIIVIIRPHNKEEK